VPLPCNFLQLLAVTGYSLTFNIRNLRDTTRLPAARILESRAVFVITELVYVYEPIPRFRFCPERWSNVALPSTPFVYHGLSGRIRNKENMNNTYSMEQSPSWEADSQLVKEFPEFYGTRRFITASTSARHLSLSWASSIQSILPHPTSWRSILILFSHLRLVYMNNFWLESLLLVHIKGNHPGSPVNVLIGKHHMPAKSVHSIHFSAKSLPRSMYFACILEEWKSLWRRTPVSAVREQRWTAAWTPSVVAYCFHRIRLLFTNPNNQVQWARSGVWGARERSSQSFVRTLCTHSVAVRWRVAGRPVSSLDVCHCTTKLVECPMVKSGIDCFSLWHNLEKHPFPPQKIVSIVSSSPLCY
jgi:hypothetical protein